jgi:prophage regulatory protein
MTTSPKLIPLREVLDRASLSKSEIYRRIRLGTFPAQVRLGPGRVAFVEAEISQWLEDCRAQRADKGGFYV